ncbi:MAG TPA: RraA family protein [Alphaproteobacteria bacterium]|nr:RraA family protein [Alphaproteobacteria bacterium]
MFVLNELPPQVPRELTDLLVKAEPATIGHFLDFGFMDPELRALLPDKRIAGTAVTCRFSGIDGTIVHYALGQLRPGDILVIDRAGDRRHAACGGGVCFAARAAGALGIIIDGPATDIGEIREYGLPVWSRGLSAVTSKRLFTHGEFCVPVTCGGVTVMPGDAILADENGILVLRREQIEAAAKRAITMQQDEKPRLARVAKGERLPDINGTNAKIREIMAAQAANKPK